MEFVGETNPWGLNLTKGNSFIVEGICLPWIRSTSGNGPYRHGMALDGNFGRARNANRDGSF
jgi:hypothetical protein